MTRWVIFNVRSITERHAWIFTGSENNGSRLNSRLCFCLPSIPRVCNGSVLNFLYFIVFPLKNSFCENAIGGFSLFFNQTSSKCRISGSFVNFLQSMSSKIPNTSPPKMYHQIYIYLDAVSPHVIQARACIKFFSILIPSRLLMLITISVLRSQITFTPSPIHSFCSSLVWLLSQPHIFDHSSQLST